MADTLSVWVPASNFEMLGRAPLIEPKYGMAVLGNATESVWRCMYHVPDGCAAELLLVAASGDGLASIGVHTTIVEDGWPVPDNAGTSLWGDWQPDILRGVALNVQPGVNCTVIKRSGHLAADTLVADVHIVGIRIAPR